MMDLSYLEGDSRDLETLIGVSTKVDNQLGLILPILKELQSTSDPELSAASIDDVSYNLSNIEADQSYMNRLAEGVETDGLLELFNEEIEKLKQTLGGESGLFVIQNRKIELYALAAESKQQINQALTQTISQITSLNKQVSADTLQGQQDILDTVSSNTVQNMLVSVFGVGATIGFAFIATRSIAKPLARVNKRLKIIASGDLTKRMTDDGNDEFSELSRNVNRLIDSLQTLIGSIHTQEETLTQITQRSIELGSANLELVATQQSQIETTSENTQSIKQTSLNNLSQIKMANDQISKAIDQSAHVVGLVEQSKNQVNQQAIQASNSATIIHRLGENSRRIGGILDVIKTIAEQTNLLALNAAIEAARAGEQGRGFAVVADEVRTLATRTHKSTEEIEEMITALQKDADQAVSAINESSEQVQKGVEITESVTEQVIQIKEIIQALSQVNNKIVEDTESQDGLLNDVYINLQNVVDLSKKAANSTHETNDATREMGVQMSSLKQAVDRFKL
jgi:methyl-accepting chemotaxis protein